MAESTTPQAKAGIIAGIENNMFAHMAHFPRRVPQMQAIDAPDVLIVNSGLPSDTFNFVCRANFTEPDIDSRIAFVIDYFTSKHLPMAWWIGPNSYPVDLAHYLKRHGLEQTEVELGMALNLAELPHTWDVPAGVTIRRVSTASELQQFARVIAANWSPPDPSVLAFYQSISEIALQQDSPARFYVGYLDDEPVATSELFLGAGVAGIYSVATVIHARRRGIGTAMAIAPLLDARNEGYKSAILQASEEGKNIYTRLGFRAYCDFLIYQ
jgi:ribosomal protein S18 acetylase RimI-like enzyme